ncbi:MAG: hypothetical protein ACTSRK_11725 [Promethearchaeota archaeon]
MTRLLLNLLSLTAIGIPEEQARSAIRITLGKGTTAEQLGRVKDVLKRGVDDLRKER